MLKKVSSLYQKALVATAFLLLSDFACAAERIASFGNWRIEYVLQNNTYNLIGSSTGETRGTFTLQCFAWLRYSLQFPLWNRERTSPGYAQVTVRSDQGGTVVLSLPAQNGFLAVATSLDHRQEFEDFVETLGSAKKLFVYSYDQYTVEFDATHLRAARTRWSQLCKDLRK